MRQPDRLAGERKPIVVATGAGVGDEPGPTLPSPPAFETAAASSTCSQGPNDARTIGTSMPSRSQTGVCTVQRSQKPASAARRMRRNSRSAAL